jgi:hypothetical protein
MGQEGYNLIAWAMVGLIAFARGAPKTALLIAIGVFGYCAVSSLLLAFC